MSSAGSDSCVGGRVGPSHPLLPVGAGNSAVVVDLQRCGPMLSPRVPNLVPIPGPRMERETPGQRPRPNYGHPHAPQLGCAAVALLFRAVGIGAHLVLSAGLDESYVPAAGEWEAHITPSLTQRRRFTMLIARDASNWPYFHNLAAACELAVTCTRPRHEPRVGSCSAGRTLGHTGP